MDGEARIITVFGSSRPGGVDADYAEARELGRCPAEHGFAVCSGGYGGVMEAASRCEGSGWENIWCHRGIFRPQDEQVDLMWKC